jgi:branched-chain amino acid transport system ATP-binding protein
MPPATTPPLRYNIMETLEADTPSWVTAGEIRVRNLTAGYGDTVILEAVNLQVRRAGRLAILGRNGVGKTTLLASLMGLTRLRAGDISFDGKSISHADPSERAIAGLGYVPQTRDIFKRLTVEENLVVGLKGRSRVALREAYELFPRLYERRSNLGSQLSGGEQQMLSVARAILGRPVALLLDEPLEGLAPVICDELMASLAKLSQTNMTIVLVEQQIDRAMDFAEQVILLDRGRVVWSGAPSVLRADRKLLERYLGVGIH